MTTRYSAIVPNYNDGSKLSESIGSLAAQKLPFYEIIIVDDASTDDSVAIIEALIAELPNARLLKHAENRGVVAALNAGIEAATGDFIFLCSANDAYYPMMTAWCEEMHLQYPQAGIISGNVAAFDQERQRFTYDMKLPLPQVPTYYSPEELAEHNRRAAIHFNGGANALRLDLVRKYKGLLPQLRWHSDWFLNLMVAFDTGVAYRPENFSMCRLEGEKSYSNNRFHWPSERHVIRTSILLLTQYPKQAALFRRSALLPKFQVEAVPLFLTREMRWFLTPLLLWRMVMFSLTYRSKYIFPRPLLTFLRPFFRL
ncbi:MAG: glycosyltransferase family 2 protein [Alphaproteobacteria bacterium]|nr:glycosyltransferase family 2 protein [Alphaproteobacteria bacterium]